MSGHPIRSWLAFPAVWFLLTTLAHAQVSGIVKDHATGIPVAGAIVSSQATTERTTTASDGTFALPGVQGQGLHIVAAKKGYYNVSAIVDTPSSDVSLALVLVPLGDNGNFVFPEPVGCSGCHPDQYQQWVDSPMSNAGTNKWVYDIYDGTGTPGGMGGFVYVRDSKHAPGNPASECASCHQPEPWIENPFSALDDINNLSPGALHGVSCEVCHKIADFDETKYDYPGFFPGTITFIRPEDPMDQVQFGVLGDTDTVIPTVMQPSYQPQLRSHVCGACHQDKNDPDQDFIFDEDDGVISEPTYIEWLESSYADPSSPHSATCVDCHLKVSGATYVSSLGEAPERDPETIRHHRIEGTTAEYLDNAIDVKVDAKPRGATIDVNVSITNDRTGHHVPTGVTVRNMILLVEAHRVSDGLELTHLGNEVVHDLGGIGNPALGYYAGLPGKFYAKVNHDEHGNGPTFFTDATGIVFDNRIPALETDATQYSFASPSGGGVIRVRIRVIYRRAFRFLVDAKAWTEDGHGNPLEDVLPPYYGHLMEERVVYLRAKALGTPSTLR